MPDSFDEIERHRAAVTQYLRYLIRDAIEAEDLARSIRDEIRNHLRNFVQAKAIC